MTRYKMLFGVTVPMLEDEVNGMVSDDSSAKLLGAFFAQGSGFIGVMEYDSENEARVQERKEAKQAEARRKAKAPEPHRKAKVRK